MHTPSRRELLYGTALGAGSAAALRRLGEVHAGFHALLGEHAQEGELRPGAMRDAYDLAPGVTYLNHASIGTVPRAVRAALAGYQQVCEQNPWLYVWGGAWEEAIARTRARAAAYLGCAADELAITHNTTEGFNHLAQGLPLGPDDEVLFSSLNHVGASRSWEHVAAVRGFRVRRFSFPVREAPGLEPADVVRIHADEIGERTKVLVLPHVDNVVGLLHPVREIASAARERGVELVAVDGAQAVGMRPVDVSGLGVDFYATSAHKWLQTPKGLGLFYVRAELLEMLRPMWVTWGHDRWKGTARIYEDYGTRDLADVLSLENAIAFQEEIAADAREEHHRSLRALCRTRVDAAPRLAWRSPREWEHGAALYAVEVEGLPSGEVFRRLFEDSGFVFRPFQTDELNSLRLSPNVGNDATELERFFDALEGLLA